ncbi:MAG: methyltransferase domain-containing protein [Candidatus Freyarchaeota archaeon]
MIKVEIGPGHAKCSDGGYRFNPRYCPDDDVIYLDIRPPDFDHQCNWIVADAQSLPFRSGSIDEMFAGHVIEHLEDPIRFLKECERVLKRGGMVTIVTPNFLSKNAYLDRDHKHVFNFIKLLDMVKTVGLTPHFPNPNLGSLFPKWLRVFLKPIFLLLSDELSIIGEKE